MMTVVIIGIARLGLAVYSGVVLGSDGDFQLTLPEAFQTPDHAPARSLDEALSGDWVLPTYTRGPTEFLTVLPLAFVGPFAAFEKPLLFLWTALIVAIALITWRIAREASRTPVALPLILASTFCFMPLLEALTEREFEVLTTMVLAAATWAFMRGRFRLGGVLLGYVCWYKYLPLALVPYLAVRRWWRALAAVSLTSVVILSLAHAAFGLERFSNNNIPAIALSRFTGFASATAFCNIPARTDGELVVMDSENDEDSIREDLCRWRDVLPAPHVIYLLMIGLVGAAVASRAFAFASADAATVPEETERWRRLLELSIVFVILATWFYSHYYYLSLLIIPLNLLLARLTASRSIAGLAWWAVTYFLLAQFLIPPFLVDRLFGISLWDIYQHTPARLLGEWMLLAQLAQHYVRLRTTGDTTASRQAVSPAATPAAPAPAR